MKTNLNIWLNLMLTVILSILISGCLEEDKPPVALGTHLKFIDMGRHIVELNLTDSNEYFIGDVITDKGYVKTGPPDSFTNSRYTQYSRDIMDKNGGEIKLSLNVRQYDAIETSTANLLEHGLSTWPWGGRIPYESQYLGNGKWITIKGMEENEIDAACWIDDNAILSLRMFNLNQSDSLAILGSVMFKSA